MRKILTIKGTQVAAQNGSSREPFATAVDWETEWKNYRAHGAFARAEDFAADRDMEAAMEAEEARVIAEAEARLAAAEDLKPMPSQGTHERESVGLSVGIRFGRWGENPDLDGRVHHDMRRRPRNYKPRVRTIWRGRKARAADKVAHLD